MEICSNDCLKVLGGGRLWAVQGYEWAIVPVSVSNKQAAQKNSQSMGLSMSMRIYGKLWCTFTQTGRDKLICAVGIFHLYLLSFYFFAFFDFCNFWEFILFEFVCLCLCRFVTLVDWLAGWLSVYLFICPAVFLSVC